MLFDRYWEWRERKAIYEAEQKALREGNQALDDEPENHSHQEGRKGLGHGD